MDITEVEMLFLPLLNLFEEVYGLERPEYKLSRL